MPACRCFSMRACSSGSRPGSAAGAAHRNLADYWTALEGVSHFQYLAWNASLNRAVSIHELEVQAEVDKYAATLFLMGAQHAGRFPVRLHHWLFERASVDGSLPRPKRELYAVRESLCGALLPGARAALPDARPIAVRSAGAGVAAFLPADARAQDPPDRDRPVRRWGQTLFF